jgi:hypothetical protein
MAHSHQALGESPPETYPCVSLQKGGGFEVASCLRSSRMVETVVAAVDQELVGTQQTVELLLQTGLVEMRSAGACWTTGWTW